jgi:hypothetical protein
MSLPRLLFYSCFMLLIGVVHGQQSTSKDDIETSVKQCRSIQMGWNMAAGDRAGRDIPVNDSFPGAVQACDELNKAISASDPAKIQSAAAALRPILARLRKPPTSPREQLAALEETTSGLNGKKLFWELPDLAQLALAAGEADKARAYSKQLLEMASQYPKAWSGNAIFYGNLVLGRIAVQEGNLGPAGQYLLAAGATPGSPQLNTFGPGMSLAKELLEKGQSGVVLQYLTLCKNFWKHDDGKLDEWSATLRSGGTPDFARLANR